MKEVKQIGGASKGKAKTPVLKERPAREGKTVTVPFPWLYALIVLFLTVPLFMFFLGYLRLSVGIPLTLIFGGIVLYAVSDCLNDPNGIKLSRQDTDLKVPVSYIIGFAITALAISFIAGVGEYICTVQDHAYRRAILRDLIDYDWPVIYNYSTQTNPEVKEIFGIASGERAFSYYFIYWMPAALIGKIFGFEAGNIAIFLWNSLGIFLSLMASSAVIKRFTKWVPFFYVFFAGLDVIPDAAYLLTKYEGWYWIEGWVPVMTYISNFREMCSVFNQMVPCFLIVALLLMSFNTRSMGLTAGVLFCYSPWAVFGILPVVGAILFSKKHKAEKASSRVMNILSPVNIASAIFLLTVFGSYYMSNSAATGYRGFAWEFFVNKFMFVPAYLLVISMEVLPFVLILFKSRKKDPVFWASVIILLIIPLYQISGMNDFCMRGSMPALFVLCIYMSEKVSDVMDAKNTPTTRKGWLKSAAVMLTVILMMFPASFTMFTIIGSVVNGEHNDKEDIGSFGNIRDAQYAETIQEQFFAKDFEDSFFYRYLAK